ncbi:hypothetical protein DE146DRAFT_243184 [Phaeosphaeria sp. MPI-PUGE-AT-0046c]|nr:hypothetical protein DE146DRAFT_243184 [Phaeosphaeria sp. MPI-PUGE-AT-0046c]
MLSTRIPVVEFRSLLSPPIRLPVRAFHSLFGPPCFTCRMGSRRPPQCLQQRRTLVLYKTAKADTVLGMHKLLPFDLYETPPLDASKHLVSLVNGAEVSENISLQEIYDEHIRPGQILYLREGPSKKNVSEKETLQEEQIHTRFRSYGILEAESISGNKKDPTSGKGQGALRVTPISLSSPAAYFRHAMDRSYQFIKSGAPVEFTMAITRKAPKDKQKRLAPTDPSLWHWMHEHFPHLRPDFILRSMPQSSRFVVDPVSDGKVVQFVIAARKPQELRQGHSHNGADPVPLSLTKRLLRVKASVQQSIEQGTQAQLPMVYRQMLHDSGNKSYSRRSSMPVTEQTMERDDGESSDSAIVYEDAGSGSGLRNRYMPMKPEEKAQPLRVDKLNKAGELKVRYQPDSGNGRRRRC